MTKRYAYFFTRQDISPEQQIVQTAHAALKLGYRKRDREVEAEISTPKDSALDASSYMNPDETYFTVVGVWGVPALEAVVQILEKFKFDYEVFIEPDMNDEPTSIAVYPIDEDKRGPLLAFNLLRVTRI